MKRTIFLVIAILMLLIPLTSCTSKNITINVDVSCDQFEIQSSKLGNEFEIEKGDSIKAKLCSNPSTGYSWDYEIDDTSIMNFVSKEYLEPEGDLVGASGTDVYLFKALKPGTTQIRIEYKRSWEEGVEAERTYTLDIVVNEPLQ